MTGQITTESRSDDGRLKIAIQKSGRLSEKSFAILEKAGISLLKSKDQLLCQARNFPLDIFLVRDDDIPAFLVKDVCQLGIIGQNSLLETQSLDPANFGGLQQVIELGFGRCRLSLAIPNGMAYQGVSSLAGKTIATSYRGLLSAFLAKTGWRRILSPWKALSRSPRAPISPMRSAISFRQVTRLSPTVFLNRM